VVYDRVITITAFRLVFNIIIMLRLNYPRKKSGAIKGGADE
jgi:hypothetical protein